jgi:Ni,Fe-hydrogenase III large subunit
MSTETKASTPSQTTRGPCLAVRVRDLPPIPIADFLEKVRAQVASGERPLALYGRPDEGAVILTAVLAREPEKTLHVLRTSVPPHSAYPSLTKDLAAFHIFEREIFEQHGITPRDHPWLKPVRFSGERQEKFSTYPFWKLEGKEVHEVGVGPIHAGVIEPGHFRFMCYGETVHHLEIALGYQHRGVEELLLKRNVKLLAPLVESIAGDSSVAYALAYSRALEALARVELVPSVELVRGIALELERIAMHLVGLAGLTTDIGFLTGSATYGRLRTAIINASMRVCGSRFGRSWVRPGGVRFGLDSALVETLRKILADFKRDLDTVNDCTFSAWTVKHRLRGTGIVSRESALEIGLVGMAARASGVSIDTRVQLPHGVHERIPVEAVVEETGDCWARARVRAREIDASLAWIARALETPGLEARAVPVGELEPNTLVVSIVEGWRGEIVHCLETNDAGALRHYKVQDPSLRNWFGLALALRGNGISDFPICNKSFDLSYCGNDL